MSEQTEIRIECCDIYNNLKDKSEMIDYLYIAKIQIAELKQQLEEKEKSIQGLLELQTIIESNCSYQMFLDNQDEIERLKKENKRIRKNWNNSKLQQTRLYNELKDKLHAQSKEIVGKIKEYMDNAVDTLINLGNGKEDAVSWFCEILQEMLKEYGESDGK